MIYKIITLCEKITKEQQERLKIDELDCPDNMENAKAHYHIKTKYTYIDIGTSGRYMIDNKTQKIFGIKAYGQIHRSNYFGTLDTIQEYNWGNYYAGKK